MTQSGQGNEPHLPAVPPAQPTQPVREGVVLPAQGDQWPSDQQHQAAPAGGQAWGQPWGPQGAQSPSPGTDPLPPEGGSYGQAAPLPPQGQPYGQQQGWGAAPAQGQPQGPFPTQGQPAQGQPHQGHLPHQGQFPQGQGQFSQAQAYQGQLPPEGSAQPFPDAADETQLLPPQPAASDAEATAYLPPVTGSGPAPGAPGPIPGGRGPIPGVPPQAQPHQDTPTTLIPKATGGAPLPPEAPKAESPAESTTQLRAVRPTRGAHRGGPAAQPMPAAQPPVHAAEETQVLPGPVSADEPPRTGASPYSIRPGRPGDRPPPAEFDGLFRSDGGAAGMDAPDETQQLPQFGAHGPAVPPSGGEPDGGGRHGGGGGRRRMSPAVLIGIVVAGCTIAGLAAGAAISAGGDDDDKKDKDTTLNSASPGAEDDKPTKAADPAQPQAKALDLLLADSNNSRAAVIRAVGNIKSCKNLSTAASDLRTAAGQRNNLVTRLDKLSVDKLPNHTQLTAALTRAWKSSATADNQYAAWADQVAGKKGCHKGKARNSPHVGAAERASGQATAAKRKAAGLWNPIASKYGLTRHDATQL
ncbi:hypothetical protein [Streptomyces cucumeris]|uniref:hypothetical protein n=1 Tax=Streptomyces cucumeris TaxID=2962890 RepID=UPI0020C89C56|nr:hypothetical protein [Streptomyces sp. NEAU-Y11]MCP9209015.1 hypothetical protein [Streptomyces sp. NEAU-Y11]